MLKEKYRVWNGARKEWVHGPNTRAALDGVNLFGETILLGGFMDGVSLEELNDCVALQCTGVKDIKGKDIFEGDILYFELDKGEGEFVWRPVVYCAKNGYFGTYRGDNLKPAMLSPENYEYKVVGNIYDTPELIDRYEYRQV